MSELFQKYVGVHHRDAPVAAAVIQPETIRQLAAITGGTPVWKKIHGGSERLSELILHGNHAKVGDYVIADRYDTYIVFPKDFFESKFKLQGVIPTTERR